MLAKMVGASIDPARLDTAVDAVAEELVPSFLALDGAVEGYWAVDAEHWRVLLITLWRDTVSLRGAATADGTARTTVGERIGLRLHSVQALPVLACSRVADLSDDHTEPGWIRVTWVDGVVPELRELVPENYGATLADQSSTRGFRGSYWLGDERSSEACAVSLWDHTADPSEGAFANRRRRRRLERTMGLRITSVHEYRIVGVAHAAPSRELEPVGV